MTFFGLTQAAADAEAESKMNEIEESAKDALEHYYTLEEVDKELEIDNLSNEKSDQYDLEFEETEKINQEENLKITKQLISDLKKIYTHNK